ncbi:MAG: penicillin-binding transpeptidase domain-containing protein [Planctomycetota bacterium]
MTTFVSESGLRPLSAFFVVGAVVVAVAGAVARHCFGGGDEVAARVVEQRHVLPEFTLVDRDGVTLACSVPRFRLQGSARTLWHSHTPQRIVATLHDVLPEATEEQLYGLLLPGTADGWLEAAADPFQLDPAQVVRFQTWLEDDVRERAPWFAGFRLVPVEGSFAHRLHWRPAEVLSERMRTAYGTQIPWNWVVRLLNELIHVVDGDAGPGIGTSREARREALWRALFPLDELDLVEDLEAHRVPAIEAALAAEKVSPHQLGIAHDRVRAYPAGDLEVVGHWGFTDQSSDAPVAIDGLERLASRMLERDVWSFLDRAGARYSYRADRARTRRANAYLGFEASPGPIVVRSTIDAELQSYLEDRLNELATEWRPAIATAIVVDVDSGEVLAIDSTTMYRTAFYPPVFHAFTPGSTFKILTMALALERGVANPDETIDVGNGVYRITHPDLPRSSRLLREADHAPVGRHPLRFCFAKSINAAFVQIGLRLDDKDFHSFLTRLGYGRSSGSGLGAERAGSVPELPWNPLYSQASVSFGHEVTTTLWQHATGLATVLRGGEWKPLTIIDGVEQGGEFYPAPERASTSVLSAATCATIRSLMREGIAYGTGRDLAIEGVEMGSKTGTTQKVAGEVCAHVALRPGFVLPRELAKLKRGRASAIEAWMRPQAPHDTCYTSSICLWGSLPGSDRTVCVLAVVDEVEDTSVRYGSKVAGPFARDLLIEALGLTRGGIPVENADDDFRTVSAQLVSERNEAVEPWRSGE